MWIGAQITITQTDMPNANDTIRVSNSVTITDPTLTGPNYTWDFSNLIPVLQSVEKFDATSSFIFPFNLTFNSFNTSYGLQEYTPDSIFGIQPDNAYKYYKESSSNFKQIGSGFTINSLPFPIVYTSSDVIYNFPLNYGNLDSSDAAWGFSLPGFGYYGQDIHRVNEVDGWGTLTTPFGTVQSLRVKSTIIIRDTVAIDSLGTGYAITRPATYEYKWLSANSKIPYLQIDAMDVAGLPVVTNIIYQDVYQPLALQLGVENAIGNINKFTVYPNPAKEFIQINGLMADTKYKLQLIDMNGRVINELQLINNQINVSSIKNGIYVLQISSIKHSGSCTVIVNH